MSGAGTAVEAGSSQARDWTLWRRQVGGILRLELSKCLFSRRSLLLYLLAGLPVAGAGFWVLGALYLGNNRATAQQASAAFAPTYAYFILGTVVYFGCVWIFMNLFRGEILDRSLHYYLLSAVRREVLVAGKFLAGLLASLFLFCGSTLVTYLLMFLPFGRAGIGDFVLRGQGLGDLAAYLGVTLLGCVGYGALFLLLGLYLRNPVLPAVLIFGWELINSGMPTFLKQISVVHYLTSLFPVPVQSGYFAAPAEPTPAWLAILGLLVFASVLLYLAALKARRLEVDYGED